MVRRTTSPQWGYCPREDQWEEILSEFPEKERDGIDQLLESLFSTLVDKEKGLRVQVNTLPEIKKELQINQLELLKTEKQKIGKVLNRAMRMAHLLDVWVILEVQNDGVLLRLQPFTYNPA